MSFVIGEEIRKKVRSKGLKNKAFAELMNIEERNLYHFFKKELLDIDQLLQASKVLNYDFVNLYIQNSKFSDHFLDSTTKNQQSKVLPDLATPINQISFSFTVKGSMESVQNEISSFLKSVQQEAESRGLTIA